MAGGVSTAAAQYLGVSLTTARIIFVAAALVGGLGLVLYSVLWLFVPDDQERVLIQGAAGTRPGAHRRSADRRTRDADAERLDHP